jgi:hypothetical protein
VWGGHWYCPASTRVPPPTSTCGKKIKNKTHGIAIRSNRHHEGISKESKKFGACLQAPAPPLRVLPQGRPSVLGHRPRPMAPGPPFGRGSPCSARCDTLQSGLAQETAHSVLRVSVDPGWPGLDYWSFYRYQSVDRFSVNQWIDRSIFIAVSAMYTSPIRRGPAAELTG